MNPTLLKDLILAGHRVACKVNNNNWIYITFVCMDLNGEDFFWWQNTTEWYSETINYFWAYSYKDIKNDFTWEYKIVTPLPQLPQVWDTVEVLEICREIEWFDEWSEDRKNMIWNKYIVNRASYNSISIWYWFLPLQVAKCEPEKEQSIQSEGKPLEIIEFNWKRYIEMK